MGKRYVTFALAAGRYCVPVDQVHQIIRLENLIPIPKPPPYVEGVINLRGDIIPVIDLGNRLGIPPATRTGPIEPEQRRRRVIIVRLGARSYGLDVDEVREIVDIDEATITGDATTLFGARAEFVLGIARREESVYIVLDLPQVLAAGRDVPGAAPAQP
jgi:purine-binding chemotaxis protein CheW